MESTKTLVKTDRNGTKYWNVTDVCPRCGGLGDYVKGINFGTCFLCGGSGKRNYIFKEYTPEHESKLEARRQAKAAKRAEEAAKYAEEHAEEIAENNAGNQDQQAGHAERIGEELRLKDIAVHKLKDAAETDKHQSMEGVNEQKHERADHAADNGTEIGDEIRHGDDYRNQTHVLHSAKEHEDRVDKTDDQRLQQALPEIAHQNCVTAVSKAHEAANRIFGEDDPHQVP